MIYKRSLPDQAHDGRGRPLATARGRYLSSVQFSRDGAERCAPDGLDLLDNRPEVSGADRDLGLALLDAHGGSLGTCRAREAVGVAPPSAAGLGGGEGGLGPGGDHVPLVL